MGDVRELRPAKSLSNRRDFAPNFGDGGQPPRFGVDRLSVSFAVGPPTVAGLRDRGFSMNEVGPPDAPQRTFGVSVRNGPALGASVFVGVAHIADKGWVGKVECNPSRFADPDGCSLLPVEGIGQAVEQMWEVVDSLGVEVRTEPHSGRVKRVDVASDFHGVGIPSFYVRGLQNIKRSHARSSYTYNNPQRNSAETLWVGSKTGGVRLYDQWEAYADKGAPVGSLRWEAEARGTWLDRHGIRSVSDLDTRALLGLANYRWEWSRMGTEVTGTASVVEAVERLTRLPKDDPARLSRAKADRLLGQLVRESLGVAATVSNDSASEYNKLKRRLGVIPAADLFSDGAGVVPVRGRLDWLSGAEVAA